MDIQRIPLWPDRDDVAVTAYITPVDQGWPFPTDPRPGILLCPGGAYLDLSVAEGAPLATYFSTQGYQAFVLEYTVASRAPVGQDLRFPVHMVDLARAVALVRERAKGWNMDPSLLALAGFSAGGHLCASYAVHWHEPWLAQRAGVSTADLRPGAVVLGYPITDYVLQNSGSLPRSVMLTQSDRVVFGTSSPTREQLEQASPCRHVNENTPPVFLVHAADDGMVHVSNSLHMAQALEEAGIPYELHIFQQGDHGFANGRPMDRPWEGFRSRACAAWLPLAVTWLLKQFSPITLEAPLPPDEEFFRAKAEQEGR